MTVFHILHSQCPSCGSCSSRSRHPWKCVVLSAGFYETLLAVAACNCSSQSPRCNWCFFWAFPAPSRCVRNIPIGPLPSSGPFCILVASCTSLESFLWLGCSVSQIFSELFKSFATLGSASLRSFWVFAAFEVF